MRVLDLFCGLGGASAGYVEAGFEVVGVDINPQPDYLFTFVRGDALEVRDWADFDLIHASPPCQYGAPITLGTNAHLREGYPDLYPPTRAMLEGLGLPYVIENPDARPDVVLCGEMFGLGVLRHRKFELGGWSMPRPAHPKHRGYVRGWRHGVYRDGPYVALHGKGGGKATLAEARAAMGIDWTSDYDQLTEAIPPAFTAFVGRAFADHQARVHRETCTG